VSGHVAIFHVPFSFTTLNVWNCPPATLSGTVRP
jgi:hypothetical protein